MLNLLPRQHVSTFALDHHQISTCIRRRTIQCVQVHVTVHRYCRIRKNQLDATGIDFNVFLTVHHAMILGNCQVGQ